MQADASPDPIERMVSFLLSSPSIPILPVDNYLNQNKKMGRQPRFDYAAILALLRAGKSVKSVAFEIRCSPLSVYKVLNAHNAANPCDEIELPPTKYRRPKFRIGAGI